MGASAGITLRIGIDVGGTNTDAVIIDTSATDISSSVLFATKITTTPNVADGIEDAVRAILASPRVDPERVASVAIGTTHFINALVERDTSRLSRVAVLRLSKSFTREIPPFSGFPPQLRAIIEGYAAYASGGLKIDGSLEAAIDVEEVHQFCREVKRRGIHAVAVVGVFSPLDIVHQQEQAVRRIIQEILPGTTVVCSSEVSNIGIIERENASILNASIYRFASKTIWGFQQAIQRHGLECPLFLTQNDGSMVEASVAEPIKTIASGPTNSMRGAAYLYKMSDDQMTETERGQSMIVCDVGGTTSDIGMLLASGYPRQGSFRSEIAGIPVNYPMPHVISIPVGGGSIVRESNSDVTLGKDSVGSKLREKSRVFGGDVTTATDVMVAGGTAPAGLGDASLVKDIDAHTLTSVRDLIKSRLERTIDLVKTSPADLPLLVVGGGSFLSPNTLSGVSRVIKPAFHDVANAVGAATANISASVDIIQTSSNTDAQHALDIAVQMATEKVLASGAKAGTVEITEKLALPLPYVENKVRTIVKVVGEFSASNTLTHTALNALADIGDSIILDELTVAVDEDEKSIDAFEYRPKILSHEGTGVAEWHVSELDLDWMATGCSFLGCGGGGSPYPELLKLRSHLAQGHQIRIVRPEAVAPSATVIWTGNMGSPAVVAERLSANECREATEEVLKYTNTPRPDFIMPAEIGGSNGLLPLSLGSSKNFDIPVIDADWMGRAFPYIWQTTLAVHVPNSLTPCAISSGDGRAMLLTKSVDDKEVDRMLRGPAVEMGYSVGLCARPATGRQVHDFGVKNTLSQAWRIGRAVARAAQGNSIGRVAEHIVLELGGEDVARVLFRGKVVEVENRLQGGFSHGEVVIGHVEKDENEEEDEGRRGLRRSEARVSGGTLAIPFQNENLLAVHVAPGTDRASGEVIASVPDLIAVVDDSTGKALGVGEYQYGIRVTVIAVACTPLWSGSEVGLGSSGPAVFGFEDVVYKPVGIYRQSESVIDEFSRG